MAAPERYDALVLGSGQGGKLLAWDLARSGRRTAVVERRWIGGGARVLHADKVFVNVGTHGTIPDLPGLQAAGPLTGDRA